MPDREKAIRILEGNYKSFVLRHNGELITVNELLALLKAQEPRVMTLEEAKSAYVVEYRSGKMREIGSALLDLNVDPLNAEYGKIYRVWTSRPTDAQREATPWVEP